MGVAFGSSADKDDNGARHATIRELARRKFRAGLVFAAIPVFVQIVIAALLYIDATPFPKADQSFRHPAFWLMRLILVGIGICSNTIVEYNATKSRIGFARNEVTYICFFFIIILVSVVLSMLDADLDWIWLVCVAISGILDIWLAYQLE
jgi:hypothetical protein